MEKPFPKLHKFKLYLRRKKRDKLFNIAYIINSSHNLNDFLVKLDNITARDLSKIQTRTIGQSHSDDWFFYRKGLITATLTKRISTAVKKGEGSGKINAAISKVENTQLWYPAIRYGRDNEQRAIEAFIEKYRSQQLKGYTSGVTNR